MHSPVKLQNTDKLTETETYPRSQNVGEGCQTCGLSILTENYQSSYWWPFIWTVLCVSSDRKKADCVEHWLLWYYHYKRAKKVMLYDEVF